MNEQFNSQYIDCPKCGERIQLTQILTDKIESEIKHKLELNYQEKYKIDEEKIRKGVLSETEEKYSIDLNNLRQQLEEKSKKIKEISEKELDLRKREREISEKEQQLEIKYEEKFKER